MLNRQDIPPLVLLLIIGGWIGIAISACQTTPAVIPTSTLSATSIPATTKPTPIRTLSPVPTVVPSASDLCSTTEGEIRREMLETPILPGQFFYTIYLPPCYTDRKEYPVLYLLHGLTYSDDQWVRLGITDTADRLITSGEIDPLIIVLPYNPNFARPAESNFGSALSEALIPHIDTHYSTVIGKEGRGIGGLSRGGGWAFDIFLKYPTLFNAVGGHSPALFQRVPERFLASMKIAWSGQRIWLDVGEQDDELHYLIRVDKDLTTAEIPHVFVIDPGEHDEIYWKTHAEEYLRWYAGK